MAKFFPANMVMKVTNMENTDRTFWMTGHYGLMNHWLFPHVLPEQQPSAKTLNEAVDRFNVERLLEEFAATGAEWLIFTLGQNTGCYISPNSVITDLAGPGHCSERDLAVEIAQGLHSMGKRFIAYLPCEVAANTSMHAGFAWNTQEGSDQAEFQQRYTRAVKEWALRFGSLLDGWWIDGCYTWPVFHSQYMNWPLWYEAFRAGNPEAALTFNDGCFCVGNLQPVRPEHDYLSGEIEMLKEGKVFLGRNVDGATHMPAGRYVPGTACQWHGLLPIDCFWGHGGGVPSHLPGHPYKAMDYSAGYGPMAPPIYSDQELCGFLQNCLQVGGAVTMNVGIYQEGYLGQATVEQLKRVRKQL
jgi:hypothetical protein